MDNSSALAFSFPSEGFAQYADNAAILRESKHQELAHEFLNYLLRPAVTANICREMKTATANAAARRLLPDNPVLYPPPDVLARGEWFRALPPETQRLRDRYWTEIKSA
jgi:spermidine/putrescine transport system substrate-binding protein